MTGCFGPSRPPGRDGSICVTRCTREETPMQHQSETLERPGKRKSPAPALKNYIGGKSVDSLAASFLPVTNPSTGEEIASVPLSTAADVDAAVRAAAGAYPAWSAIPIKERAQVFYRYK